MRFAAGFAFTCSIEQVAGFLSILFLQGAGQFGKRNSQCAAYLALLLQ
jgi:hypothetical protein